MRCLHPQCPRGEGAPSWDAVLDQIVPKANPIKRADALARLNQLGSPGTGNLELDFIETIAAKLLSACPCLYTQAAKRCSGRAVVHLCEITLNEPISAANVEQAFAVQHPAAPRFVIAPLVPATEPGQISEALCSEILTNAGLPAMQLDDDGWPIWEMPGHLVLNQGKMRSVKAFGDILIPAAPTNLVVSVKTETAKERLLYSANAIEAVGFGFFNTAAEFWSISRLNLFKRMGFTAIYMPATTFEDLQKHLENEGQTHRAVNINGTALYRPISAFTDDMLRVAGRSTLDL